MDLIFSSICSHFNSIYCDFFIGDRRNYSFGDLSRIPDARLFNYKEERGYNLVVKLCKNKNYLVEQQNGPEHRGPRGHILDSRQSMELVVKDRVPTFSRIYLEES